MEKKLKRFAAIGDRLRCLRALRSQKEFAERIGISLRAYQQYESGERTLKAASLYKIAGVCQVPIEWILTGKNEKFYYIEDPASLIELMKLDNKKKKTAQDLARMDEIKDKAAAEIYEKRGIIEGRSPAEIKEYIASLPKPIHKNFEGMGKILSKIYPVDPLKTSPLFVIIKQIGRILDEGNEAKIEAIRAQLNALDPGEKYH